jgi:hypothetical protein
MKQSLSFLTALLMLSACGNAGHDQHSAPSPTVSDHAEMHQLTVTDTFQSTFELALDAYFDLKDALVETNASKAADQAGVLHSRMQVVNIEGLSTEAAALWAGHGTVATEATQKIVNETDVERQRLYFEDVSNAFIDMAKAYGPFENTVFRQTCPMVRGGSADWLSREERIMNPYHGSRMMNCGSVVERI